MGKVVERSISG